MNIALISEFFPPYVTGGAEIFLKRLADHLRLAGHKIVVITTDQGHGDVNYKTYRIKSSPMHISHRYQFHGVTLPWMFGNIKLKKKLEGIYKKECIDLVYINNMFHLSFAPLQAAESACLPVVLDIHDYWPICFSKEMLYKYEPYDPCTGEQNIIKCSGCVARKMGFKAAAPALMPGLYIERMFRKKWISSPAIKNVIVHAEQAVEEMRKHNIESISIPYPYFGPKGQHVKSGDGVFRIIFVGRLEKVRNAHLLLEIAKHLLGKNGCAKPRFKFRIDVIGKGSLMSELDRKDLNIHVHGFLGDERFEFFKRADCLLALQRGPVPFGINVIEGMAFCVPMVGFNNCGPDWLNQENKIGLSYSNDVNGIVESIRRIQKDKEFVQEIIKNELRNIKRYDKTKIFSTYEKVMLSAVA